MADDILSNLQSAYRLAEATRNALTDLQDNTEILRAVSPRRTKQEKANTSNIYRALHKLSEPLAQSYAQAIIDLQDVERQSWAGTAHEIREALRGILEVLAPDSDVTSQPGFNFEKGRTEPTQKQKVVYILRQRQASSSVEDVVKQVNTVEERVGSLVRAIYSRASNAAHTSKDRGEVTRILKYFEAFAHDLLNLD